MFISIPILLCSLVFLVLGFIAGRAVAFNRIEDNFRKLFNKYARGYCYEVVMNSMKNTYLNAMESVSKELDGIQESAEKILAKGACNHYEDESKRCNNKSKALD